MPTAIAKPLKQSRPNCPISKTTCGSTTSDWGRLEQELEAFRQDRTLIELRFERAQAEVELQQLVQELGGIELARRAVDQLRERLEAERQPATLRSAGQYLQQLTAGKYQARLGAAGRAIAGCR